ncbi:MAG: hypothetical protein RIS54_349 [Verrucomicrobiota bacterium]|jgi:TonB family protein
MTLRWLRLGTILLLLTGLGIAELPAKDRPPVPKFRAPPEYPMIARFLNMEGEVLVEFVVDTTGKAILARAIRSTHAVFSDPAVASVSKWIFEPSRRLGQPVQTRMQVPIIFRLEGKPQELSPEFLATDTPPRPRFLFPALYPASLLRSGVEGRVDLEFTVGIDGRPTDIRILSSTLPDIEKPALQAVSQWLFIPARKDGQLQAQNVKQQLRFLPPRAAGELPGIPQAEPRRVVAVEQLSTDEPRIVYPFEQLLANEQCVVELKLTIDAQGKRIDRQWSEEIPEPFRFAVDALIDLAAATAGPPEPAVWGTSQTRRIDFNPTSGDAEIDDASAAILKRLRLGGEAAEYPQEADLNEVLVTVKEAEPIFPSQLDDAVTGGEAEIEFFVDRSGAVRLPRIVSASEPAFGYAACQAVAAWAFSEPRQAGAPVIVRVRRTLTFARPVER